MPISPMTLPCRVTSTSRAAVTALLVPALFWIGLVGCDTAPKQPDDTKPPIEGTPVPANGDVQFVPMDIPLGFPGGDERRLRPDQAPTPYTSEQIRLACPPGRINRFRVEQHRGDESRVEVSVQHFVESNEFGAKIKSVSANIEKPVPGPAQEILLRWDELRAHASYPAEQTKITRERVTVPAGSYDCWLYTVKDGDFVSRYWFAIQLPGPPVRAVVEKDGKVVRRIDLIDLAIGSS